MVASSAHPQTQNSTTNCHDVGGYLTCNTTTAAPPPGIDWEANNRGMEQANQQNLENIGRSMQSLGAAIAAGRENKRRRKEADALQKQSEADQAARMVRNEQMTKAYEIALAQDNVPAPPPPIEKPIVLACQVGDSNTSLALYEKAGRVDVTTEGLTKARAATYTPDAVSWTGPVWRTSVSRVDLSLISVAILPELDGAQMKGTCSLAERKF